MSDRDKTILNSLMNPEKYGSLRDHMMLNGWKWSHVQAVIQKNPHADMRVSSYFIDAIRWEFRD